MDHSQREIPRGSAFTKEELTVEQLIREAVNEIRDELPSLRAVADLRYDRSTFPTIGQYDWVAAQVLYALVRKMRPRTIVEFSTSSGYSTTFMASALIKNGRGRIHTVDIDARAQDAAGRWLTANGLSRVVDMHHGDCRAVVPGLLDEDVDLVFIDTLHSFDIAEWYFAEVIPRLRPDALVHIHDVMPAEARVRIHGGPPYAPEPSPQRPSIKYLLKRFVWLLLHLRWPNPFPPRSPREILPLHSLTVKPPAQDTELPSIDGNYFEEAVLIRELLRGASSHEAVYLHRLHADLPVDEPGRYTALDLIGRTDSFGNPLEWNDALWCRASTLQHADNDTRVRSLVRELRHVHYRSRK
jgi:predicted O-methyltransferase YrrM